MNEKFSDLIKWIRSNFFSQNKPQAKLLKIKKHLLYFSLRFPTQIHFQVSKTQILKKGKNHSTLLYSRVEWFWNLHLAHQKMDSDWNSQTKIEKAFSLFCVVTARALFLWNFFWPKPLNKVRIFFLSKYDFMGIKISVILWRFQKCGRSLVTKCT